MQKLEVLLKTLTATVPDVGVQNVTVIDTQSGNLATQAAAFMTQLKQTSGVDLAGAINRVGGPKFDDSTPAVLSEDSSVMDN
ncbi:MAG: hypothetical protein ACFB16_26385 [Phormidesmis sp.]